MKSIFLQKVLILLSSILLIQVCTASNDRPPAPYNNCQGAVQDQLNYGISAQKCVFNCISEEELLAESVCCDKRNEVYAEPANLFEDPNVHLFASMNKTGINTFYDSVCGVELFNAPIGRSFEDWEAESKLHGWPSFRIQEINKENVHFDEETGTATSSCGTHLGSYSPDDQGPRFCTNLSCISGRALKAEQNLKFLTSGKK